MITNKKNVSQFFRKQRKQVRVEAALLDTPCLHRECEVFEAVLDCGRVINEFTQELAGIGLKAVEVGSLLNERASQSTLDGADERSIQVSVDGVKASVAFFQDYSTGLVMEAFVTGDKTLGLVLFGIVAKVISPIIVLE